MRLQDISIELVQRLQVEAKDISVSENAQKRLAYLAYYCEHGRSVTNVCLQFGIARGTFYRVIDRLDPENIDSLEDQPRINPRDLSVISPELIALVREYKTKFPTMGREKIHLLLFAEHGIAVSSSTIGRIIDREHLYNAEGHEELMQRPIEKVQTLVSEKHSYMTCTCFTCRLQKKFAFLKLRPKILVISIVINILVLGSLLGTILWESKMGKDAELPLHTAAPETVITLDTPSQQ